MTKQEAKKIIDKERERIIKIGNDLDDDPTFYPYYRSEFWHDLKDRIKK